MTKKDFKEAVAATNGRLFHGYVRYSAAASPQADARQRASIHAYLASIGAKPVQIEEDLSHAYGGRPGLARLLRAIEEGRCTDVVVEDFDRMTRDAFEAAEIRARLRRAGVRLHLVSKANPLADPAGPSHSADAERLRRSALARDGLARARARQSR